VNMNAIVQYFDLGGALRVDASSTSEEIVRQLAMIQGLLEKTRALGLTANEPDALRAAAGEFILEGLYAHRRVGRSEELGFVADEQKRRSTGHGEEEDEQQPQQSSRRRRQFN
jgi:magnesium chelatase subunit I